jgi:hypothetical protein
LAITYLNASGTMNLPLVQSFFAERSFRRVSLRVFFQVEHNLVLPGGRGLRESDPVGVVTSMFDRHEKYRVRVWDKPLYLSSDVVIEPTMQNVENIRRSNALPRSVMKRIVYGPSIPWAYDAGGDRPLQVITNFGREDEPRRAEIMERLLAVCPSYANIRGVYGMDAVRDLYSSTRIIVNVHQTKHHHSIEEFRVLPALSRGCIVISEDVPLREVIPYGEHVLWCSYDEIPDLVAEVESNYEAYFETIHGQRSELGRLFDEMRSHFRQSLSAVLSDRSNFTTIARAKRRTHGLAQAINSRTTAFNPLMTLRQRRHFRSALLSRAARSDE